MFTRILPQEIGGTEACQDPWQYVPDEVSVEWDRDVAPLLEGMPDDTIIYFDTKEIGDHLYVSVSFSVKINNHIAFKSVYWTRPAHNWSGGWRSNYCAPSVAAELDWTKHPGLDAAP